MTKTLVAPVLVTTPPKLIEDLSFKLGHFSDDILSEMGVDQMRTLLIDARDILSSAAPTPSAFLIVYFFHFTSTSFLTSTHIIFIT